MRPYLDALVDRGVGAFGDCSPRYLGRDPEVLARLSELTGLHILTNTGLYKEPYLPPEVFDAAPQDLAAGWIDEWEDGIMGSGVRPGFVKIAVNPGSLVPVQRTIVRAAAITHLATGLVVASHTGHAVAAAESLDIIESEGMDPGRFIIVHADQIDDLARHYELAGRGAWLEYDSIGAGPMEKHVRLVTQMLERGFEDRLLLSQDAGWYRVGEPHGGEVRPYTDILDHFVPMLRGAGVTDELIHKLFVLNPRRALAVAG
jgi:phosphotriesterase-related protein